MGGALATARGTDTPMSSIVSLVLASGSERVFESVPRAVASVSCEWEARSLPLAVLIHQCHQLSHSFRVDRIRPMPVNFEIRSDDESVGGLIKFGDVVRVNARA